MVARLPAFEPGGAADARARARAFSADRPPVPGRDALGITEELGARPSRCATRSGCGSTDRRAMRPPAPPWSTSTAAGSSPATSTPRTSAACASPTTAAAWSCRSTTASRPSTATPPRSTTATRRSAGPRAAAPALGVDPERIGVAGASSGGNLAAAPRSSPAIAAGRRWRSSCLVYPTLDDRMQTASAGFVGTPMVDGSDVARCWDYYLGDDRAEVSPYAAPGRAADLAGLPPAYVMTAELDPLRDEGLRYATATPRSGRERRAPSVRRRLPRLRPLPHCDLTTCARRAGRLGGRRHQHQIVKHVLRGGTMKRLRTLLVVVGLVVAVCGGQRGARARPVERRGAEGHGGRCHGQGDPASRWKPTSTTRSCPASSRASSMACRAGAKYLNSKAGGGGVAGRKLVVDFIDSKLNPNEARNGVITACRTTSPWSARRRCSCRPSTTR